MFLLLKTRRPLPRDGAFPDRYNYICETVLTGAAHQKGLPPIVWFYTDRPGAAWLWRAGFAERSKKYNRKRRALYWRHGRKLTTVLRGSTWAPMTTCPNRFRCLSCKAGCRPSSGENSGWKLCCVLGEFVIDLTNRTVSHGDAVVNSITKKELTCGLHAAA